eukprot:GILJ01007003.1.p1 GENE.GILJ01007003.1~~GILJ01007003.1.p1  ORF type:complete len:124 (-),score=0.66 GILJ01007003.1:201-572(-)
MAQHEQAIELPEIIVEDKSDIPPLEYADTGGSSDRDPGKEDAPLSVQQILEELSLKDNESTSPSVGLVTSRRDSRGVPIYPGSHHSISFRDQARPQTSIADVTEVESFKKYYSKCTPACCVIS